MEPTPPPNENVETIREPVVRLEDQVVVEDSDRSPTKTERDAGAEASAKAEAADEESVVRNLVLPVSQAEDEDSDRSPTKTERGLVQDAIPKPQ